MTFLPTHFQSFRASTVVNLGQKTMFFKVKQHLKASALYVALNSEKHFHIKD